MKRVFYFVLSVLLVSTVWADDAFRDFKSKDGKVVRGRVCAFDESSDAVTIETENKRTSKVPISVFSEEDQAYIKVWQNQQGVRSSSKLRITVERKAVKSWVEKQYGSVTVNGEADGTQQTGKTNFEEIAFDMELANRNSYPIKDLVLEYCIYYEQELEKDQAAKPGVLFGTKTINRIAPNGKMEFTTDAVTVFEFAMGSQFADAYELDGQVFGCAMRLYLQQGDEKTLVREERCPTKLPSTYEWESKSRVVGKNK